MKSMILKIDGNIDDDVENEDWLRQIQRKKKNVEEKFEVEVYMIKSKKGGDKTKKKINEEEFLELMISNKK